MRILIQTLILLLLISCRNSDEPTSAAAPPAKLATVDTLVKDPISSSDVPQVLENVDDIRKEYEYVASKIKSRGMDSTSFSYNCNEEKKGTVVYFFENDALRMIRHTYHEYSHFSATDSYFVKDSATFFVYFNRVSWSFDPQGKGASDTKDDITENRFYIINNKPVKCLEKKFVVRSADLNKPTTDLVSNKEIACSSIQPVLQKFQLLAKYKTQEKSIACLEE